MAQHKVYISFTLSLHLKLYNSNAWNKINAKMSLQSSRLWKFVIKNEIYVEKIPSLQWYNSILVLNALKEAIPNNDFICHFQVCVWHETRI